jgi:hypothetical protein
LPIRVCLADNGVILKESCMPTDLSGSQVSQGTEAQALLGDPRWEVAERAAQSQALGRATQLRSILLYIVRQAILDPEGPIHEFDIAHRVLGRQKDFNPLDDNIVRVQMTRLRKRLDVYFSEEGKNEELVISVLSGSYKPVFNRRKEPDPEPISERDNSAESGKTDASEGIEAVPAVVESPGEVRHWDNKYLMAGVAALLALIMGALGGFLYRPIAEHSQKSATITNPVIRQLFAPGDVVNVVVADGSLVLIQDAVHSDISIAEYLDRSYPDKLLATTEDPALLTTLKAVAHHSLTSLNNADVAGECFRWAALLGSRVYIRYARYMHVRDFERGNFVIVGSRRSNPWTSLFERNLNFYLEEDPTTHTFHFRNRKPNPGEPEIYAAQYEGSGVHIGYVDIAILPNLTGTGTVLLFNGLRMENDEAASNLIFSGDTPASLTRALASVSRTSTTEILLRVRSLGGAENGWEVVSVHSSSH